MLRGVVLTQVLVTVEAVSGGVCERIVSGRRIREIALVTLFEFSWRRVSPREALELTFEEFKVFEFGMDQVIFLRNSDLDQILVVVGQVVMIELVKSISDVISLFFFIKSLIKFTGPFWVGKS